MFSLNLQEKVSKDLKVQIVYELAESDGQIVDRDFKVSILPNGRMLSVLVKQTGERFHIPKDAVDTLKDIDFDEQKALDILIELKEIFSKSNVSKLKSLSYKDIADIIADVYEYSNCPVDDWIILKLKAMPNDELEDIFAKGNRILV
mgnify:FL=1